MIDSIDKEAQYMEELKTATPDSSLNENKGKTSVKDSFKEDLEVLRIKATDKIKAPPIAIKLLNSDSKFCPSFTLGNFSGIIGKAKSRKSFAVCLMASSALIYEPIDNRILCSLPEDKREVLYFDTEQSSYDVLKVAKRICALSGNQNNDKLHLFALRSKTPAERLKLIDYAINEFKNVGLVIIDGIRDLISSINDEAEGTMVTSKLLKWTEEKNIHIVTVLHQNKGKGNTDARGHIGTELINKAESIFSVTVDSNDKDVSIIEAEQTRGIAPDPIPFKINAEGIPFVCDIPKSKHKRIEAHLLLTNDQIMQLIEDVIQKDIKAGEFKDRLKVKLKEDYPRTLTGASAMTDFYQWLSLKEYIKVEGSASSKIIKKGKFKKEGKQSELPMK